MYSVASLMSYIRHGHAMCQDMASSIFSNDILSGFASKKKMFADDSLTTTYAFTPEKKFNKDTIPLLILFPLINKSTVLDLLPDRSLVKAFLKEQMPVAVIDWGEPTKAHKTLGLDDYIVNKLNSIIDKTCKYYKTKTVNLLGISQGGNFALCYASLFPAKINRMALLGTPVDFYVQDFSLAALVKQINIELLVNTLGNVPGNFINSLLVSLKPYEWISKQGEIVRMENETDYAGCYNSLKIKQWIFDTPDIPGKFFQEYTQKFIQENQLAKGQLKINNQLISLNTLKTPTLNILAQNDYLIPHASSKILADLLPDTTPYQEHIFKTTHVGLYLSKRQIPQTASYITQWMASD